MEEHTFKHLAKIEQSLKRVEAQWMKLLSNAKSIDEATGFGKTLGKRLTGGTQGLNTKVKASVIDKYFTNFFDIKKYSLLENANNINGVKEEWITNVWIPFVGIVFRRFNNQASAEMIEQRKMIDASS